jgi:hypothetical protein
MTLFRQFLVVGAHLMQSRGRLGAWAATTIEEVDPVGTPSAFNR